MGGKSKHDLETAALLIELKPLILDIACFHCQQVVEKLLKAYLVYNLRDIERTHNLNYLQAQCAELDADFLTYNFSVLSEFAVDVPYPDSFLQPDLNQTKEFYAMANEIQKLVLSKIYK
jgi:HEPN domain-containing protein